VVIGKNCTLTNVTLGPNTSIGDGCTLTDCHIVNSVVLEDCQISGIDGRIDDSLIGRGCEIKTPSQQSRLKPPAHKFLLADHSNIQVV
jgi:glucose-1-phosphate thymidylyltransferase